MMALNLHDVGDLRYEEVPCPERKPGEVLLKIKAVGICGSDIPRVFTKGTYHFPTIIGHEFAGEIVEAEDAELVGRGASIFPLLPRGKILRKELNLVGTWNSSFGSRENDWREAVQAMED